MKKLNLIFTALFFINTHCCIAQKIKTEDMGIQFTHNAKYMFSEKHKTFKVVLEMGDVYREIGTKPALKGLVRNDENPDLIVKLFCKGLYVTNRSQKTETTNNKTSMWYVISYDAVWGFQISDAKTTKEIYKETNKGGKTTTKSFSNQSDLDGYMNNVFTSDLAVSLIRQANQQIAYIFNDIPFDVKVEVKTIEAKGSDYSEVNNATLDLIKVIESKNVDKSKISPVISILKANLTKVDFENKDALINKKVAKALANNICVASMLIEDYQEMTASLEMGIPKAKGAVSGLLADDLSFRLVDSFNFIGPYSSYRNVFNNQYYIIDYKDFGSFELELNKKLAAITME